MPFIVAAPGAKAGQVCRSLVELVDLYPTVADYCRVAAPHALAGQSLRARLENPAAKGRDAAYTLVTRGAGGYGQAVRTAGWRYIQWSDGRAELYDEVNDPEETRNLAGDSRHAALVKEHQHLLKRIGPFTSTETRPPQRSKRPE